MSLLRRIGPLIWIVLLLTCPPALAQPGEESAPVATQLEHLKTALGIIEQGLERVPLTSQGIAGLRQQVDFVTDRALALRAEAARKAKEQSRLLDALGTAPAEGEAPESPQIAEERERLQAAVAEYQGQVKSANVLLARANTLRERLIREEFGVLARVLVQKTPSPLAPELIATAVSEVAPHLAHFRERLAEWWATVEFTEKRFDNLVWWLVMLVVVVSVVVPGRKWVLRRYGPDHRVESPSFPRRFRVMLAVGLGKVVLPVVSIAGLYVVFINSAAPTPEVHHMAWIVTLSLCQFFLVTGLSAAALSPDYPHWRISDFTNASATGLYWAIWVFASLVVILNLAWVPLSGSQVARAPVNVLVMDVAQGALLTVFGAVTVLIIAGSMLNILRKANWHFVREDESGECVAGEPSRVIIVLFQVAKLGLLLGVGAALIGYVNLGIFLVQRIVWSLLLIAFAYLVRAFFAGLCGQAAGESSEMSPLLKQTLGYSKSGAARLMFWVMLAMDIFLSLAVIVLLLLVWGVQATEIMNVAGQIFYGISIGDYTLSLVDILVALGLFVLLFLGVRLFQGFLSNRVLAQTVPDVGVRDALTTGVGYTGVIIAAIIAVSSLGLELSQLAIILGALSVGIGFGLQHVVNNFVSGLILLMHRPVKAGDWVVVGQHEGYVKKVNVVATEIQTFDNAELIVPNSQLVSSELLNWTHKSPVARVVVPVSVSYDADPRRVYEILLECAERSGDVLRLPAPTVVFRDFGNSGLLFELRFFIRQADYMLIIASNLRFAIYDAFDASGIEIPYPQHDVHIQYPERPYGGEEPGVPPAPAGRAGKKGASRGIEEPDSAAPDQGELD